MRLILSVTLLFICCSIALNAFQSVPQRNGRKSSLTRKELWPFEKAPEPTGVAVIDAVRTRNEASVKGVIARDIESKKKALVNEVDSAGNNALHIIAKEGHYKYPPSGIPKLLVDSGININAKNQNGQTALEISLLSGWQKIAILLLDSEADKSVVTDAVKNRITCPDCKRVVQQYNL